MAELTRTFSPTGLVPLAPPKLISRDGFVGVFTPIAEQGAASAQGTDNLREIVDRLTKELGSAQQKNIELQSRLEKMLAPATSSDDLASALQRTVNRLQNELASLSNPVSNFAVKDFRLETSLSVGVTELGSVEFRLLQPGATVDPAAISKLTLSLVPIEKQRVDGTFASSLFEPDKELAAIGVSAPLREMLERNHIFTVGEFRTAAMRAQVRTLLLASQRTTQAELARLQARAELVLLAGVDRATADALIDANIDSLRALGSCSPEGLALIVPRIEPAALARWIDAAKTFNGKDVPLEPAQHVIAVNTDPSNLLVRLGGEPFASTPIATRLRASEPVVLRTLRTQLHDDAGYRFERWSNGATTTAITETAATDITASAAFKLIGYSVHALSPSEGGKVTLFPAVGGLAQLPAGIFAAGASIQIVTEPGKGYMLRALTITTQGTTRTVTTPKTPITVKGPIKASATFMARPATISSIAPPAAARAGGFQSRVIFASREPVPAFDLRITGVKFETTGGTGDVKLLSALPIVFGDLPVGMKTRELMLAYDIPATVTDFNIFLTVQLKNATGDVLVDERSIGHRNPGVTQ